MDFVYEVGPSRFPSDPGQAPGWWRKGGGGVVLAGPFARAANPVNKAAAATGWWRRLIFERGGGLAGHVGDLRTALGKEQGKDDGNHSQDRAIHSWASPLATSLRFAATLSR